MEADLNIGDLVRVLPYYPESPWNDCIGIVIGQPNHYRVFPVYLQISKVKRNFTFGELEKLSD